MAASILFTRTSQTMLSSTTIDLLVVFIALITTSLVTLGVLFVIRRYRRSGKDCSLPLYASCCSASKLCSRRPNLGLFRRWHRSQPTCIYSEKQDLLYPTSRASAGPLPEIRITFPEELDEYGKTQSGRVVVVHVGEKGDVGLEPLHETLPAYQKSCSDKFQSLDLERIGGLKEKALYSN